MSQPGQPKPAFYLALVLVAAGLGYMAYARFTKSSGPGGNTPAISLGDEKAKAGAAEIENPAGDGITTVKEYSFEPAKTLPPVTATSDYKKLGAQRTVHFALNVWAGWAPIIYANGGKGPKKVWKDSKGNPFTVSLDLIDDPVAMGNTFAEGSAHIGWGTVDMLPLIVQRLNRDPRTMPRVVQQIDWSSGGDGIVVRDNIKSIADLRGKKVVLAQNSPSHFFLLNMLLSGGVQPSEVKMVFTPDAFKAAAAFNQDKSLAGCVSWAPDIYNLEKVPGNRILVTTATANKLIGDVWFARADFARDNPEIIEGLVRGIFDAMIELSESEAKKQEAAKLMDDLYGLPAGSGNSMMADAHSTNYAENRDFFMNQNNPTNFERTYNLAYQLYRHVDPTLVKVPYDQILDFSVIKALGNEPKYANQKNEYVVQFTPTSADGINVEDSVLTKSVMINFFPNSFELEKKVPSKSGKEMVLYDPNVGYTVDQIAQLAGQFGAARIVISGHTDASKRGEADPALVIELSQHRADAVKEALVRKFKMDPAQFITKGYGWDRPADPTDPSNHAKNRRVEIRVVPAEAQ